MCSLYLIQTLLWVLFSIRKTLEKSVNCFPRLQVHVTALSKAVTEGSYVKRKKTDKVQQTVLIPFQVCVLRVPITQANIIHAQMGELKYNKIQILPGSTKCLLSVFLAWSACKSLAQVHTASCGTFKGTTYCSKIPWFCLTYKSLMRPCIYLPFSSKLIWKRCQNRLV